MKEFSLDFAGGEGPVANGLAVLEDDGPEDAVAAVGAVHVVGVNGQVEALVGDKVFVVGREQGDGAAAEAEGAAVLVAEELKAFPAVFD